MPSVAVTTIDEVPLGVVIKVDTESVAVAGYELTEFGVIVPVAPDGRPEVTERLTVPLYPPKAAKERVYDVEPPAPTLCEVGEALIEKSDPTTAESSMKVVLPSAPFICKSRTVYESVV